uniref:Zona pellucida sperm-binding protein 4 n=1 Tax=Electrophorus electricus TaxID=8005 RepID=A0AAY5ENA1_ELEEL
MLGATILFLFSYSMSVSNARDPNALQVPQYWPGVLSVNQPPQVAQAGYRGHPALPGPYQQALHEVPAAADPAQRCEVAESSRVQCAEPGVDAAACEALRCCYELTVQCTRDGQFVVVVARDSTLPRVDPGSLSVPGTAPAGGSCAPVDGNVDFSIWQFPVSSCGTSMKMEGDDVVYENMMVSLYEVGIGARGAITRDSSFVLMFQCKYLATAVASLDVRLNTLPPPLSVSRYGPLRVELRLANGVCAAKQCSDADMYSSYYTEADYPVTKVLRDPLYVEVRLLERTDPNLTLVLDQCWATSSPDPSSKPQWDLLVDGCPFTDDHYLVTLVTVGPSSGMQYPTHYKRFIVKMFTFVENALLPLQEQVFIHCTTSLCELSAVESCTTHCGRRSKLNLNFNILNNTSFLHWLDQMQTLFPRENSFKPPGSREGYSVQ